MNKGFTLIETVVAVGIFAMLSVIGSTLLVGILRGSKKAAAIVAVRTEGANIINGITQTLRFAQEVQNCGANSITFITQFESPTTYSCSATTIASGSANLNTVPVKEASCSIVCPLPSGVTDIRKAKYVDIGFTLKSSQAEIPFKTQVVLRNRD